MGGALRPVGGQLPVALVDIMVAAAAAGGGSDLRIGVSKAGGRFEAHAWIEYQGVVVNDQPDVRERYGAFELPANSAIPFS